MGSIAKIVNWCNINNGFLTALLSLLTLIVSTIAVIISVHTARLPYRKKLILSSKISWLLSQDSLSGQIASKFNGISVEATNIGNRNINISFLGFAVKTGWKTRKIQATYRDLGGKGIITTSEVATVEYKPTELEGFCEFKPNARIYCYATDSEGKNYAKYYGKVKKVVKNLRKMH